MDTPWTVTPDEVSRHFNVDPHTGLSPDQVRLHSERYGTNGARVLATYTPFALLTMAFNERTPGGTRNTHLGANPRAIQGPARPHPSWVCRHIICVGLA